MPSRFAAVAAAAASAVAVLAMSCPAPAGATPGLVDDTNVSGYLGFCDTSGQQVRGGLVAAAPFAWTTVSSVPAPAGYEKGKASIVAYQPRQQVDPIDWSGKQLNAASTFTNAKHPMASSTRIDASFSDFTGTYTPKVDGLIQVRMYFTGVNQPMYAGSYPAVLVKVSGDRWTQVGGGAVDCKAGTARSVELDRLSASRLKLRNPRPSPQTARQLREIAARKTGSPNGTTAAGNSGATAGSGATSGGSVDARPAADATSSSDGGSGSSWLWFAGAGLIVVLAAGFVVRRRQLGRGTE